MPKTFAIIITLAAFLSGCATQGASIPMMQPSIVVKPELNTLQIEELGNTLASLYISSAQASIRTMEPWGFVATKKIYSPQILKPITSGERYSKYFVETPPTELGNTSLGRFVCFDVFENVFFLPNGFGSCDSMGKAIMNSGPIAIQSEDYIDIKSPRFKQELIYNGKSGNTVKFLYRELSGDSMRGPFTQDIQYDLSEGSTIGFKGARIEIVKSTNRSIEYKVLKMFDR
ncbi:MAG: hypothetical protein U1E02_17850 [Hydrogenophaga sp.]|nr:hypothetical protein [Hydrogenophaga sp.]